MQVQRCPFLQRFDFMAKCDEKDIISSYFSVILNEKSVTDVVWNRE